MFRNIHSNRKKSLSGILIFNFLLFFMIIFVILAVACGYLIFLNQEQTIILQHQLVAHEAIDIVRNFFNEKFVTLEITARMVNPLKTSRDVQEQNLNYLLGARSVFRRLVLKDSENKKLVDKYRIAYIGSDDFLTKNIQAEIYTQTRQAKKYSSKIFVDSRSNEPIIFIAVPIKDYFGDFNGSVIAELNLKFMWDLIEKIQIGKTGVAYIVDRSGTLIAFHDVSRVLTGENLSNLKIVHEFMEHSGTASDNQVFQFTGITGSIVKGSYVPIGEPDFAVITEQSIYEAYQSLIQLWILSFIFSIVIWIVVVLISIRLGRRLSIPLVDLMTTAVRIAQGERELYVPVSGPVEITNMAEAFNSMTSQLNNVISSLETHNQYLQSSVQKYVDYMAEVGKGNFDISLEMKNPENNIDDPLIVLGHQLNNTSSQLKLRIDEIQQTTNKLKLNEEKLLVYSNQLEESNKELEQFAYIASHDLQEPLRKLKFYNNRLTKNYSHLLDEKAIDYIESMMNAVSRMENLIQGLLKYSRITTEAKSFEAVDLNEIVREVISDLEIRIEETGATINTEQLPVVQAEPLLMRQLFQNLIGNAIKYKQKDIPPIVNIKYNLDDETGEENCKIVISDNDIGFNNQFGEQIFALFKRLHGRSEYDGTGIGLSICKKIVEKHGGSIKAVGDPGKGAVFHFTLPLK